MRLHLPQLFLVGLRRSFAGNVFLIGAGPGDPDLLTVKAVRILREADLVLHDDLVSPAILSLPCLAVSRATTPEEHVRRARLDELPEVEVPTPSLLLVAPPRLDGS